MLSVETCALSRCATILARWELSASSGESRTKMAEFISTLSLISAQSADLETLASLMLEDATQMLYHLAVHRRRVGTMRRKMETLRQGDLSDQTEADFLQLAMRGIQLSHARVETSFGVLSRNWLLEASCVISTVSEHTRIGSSGRIHNPTYLPQISALTRSTFLDCRDGYQRIWVDIQVSVLAVAYAVRLARARFGGILPGGAPPTPQPARSRPP